MSNNDKVRQHFQKAILDFDLIYTEEKSKFRRFLDSHFRQDNYERFELTLQECADIRGKRILDIGCGAGRYCVELAKLEGKAPRQDLEKLESDAPGMEITGLDFSENALKIARKLAEDNGVSNICTFICSDFASFQSNAKYHISIAIGLFDYISDPVFIVSKMRDITTEKLIMTFPSKSTYRMVIRKTRYWLKGCPLFLYSKDQIRDIMAQSNIIDYTIRKLSGMDNSGDFFVVAGGQK